MKKLLVLFMTMMMLFAAGCGDDAGRSADGNKPTTKVEQKKAPEVPREYRNALRVAENYNEVLYMSKQGLYDQLTSSAGEKFPPEAAQYAVDNIKANWKENALKKARDYDKMMPMSRQALYDQLTSSAGEKFTPEEARYAVDNM